jgi:hypothetical protein
MPGLAQSLSNTSSLAFGTFVATSAGSVSVRPDGSRMQSGGAWLLQQGGGASPARFLVQGTPNTVYAITLPANGSVQLSDGAGHSMSLQAFEHDAGGLAILSSNGMAQFSVGATLSVGSAQAEGAYSGAFSVIVNYQ